VVCLTGEIGVLTETKMAGKSITELSFELRHDYAEKITDRARDGCALKMNSKPRHVGSYE